VFTFRDSTRKVFNGFGMIIGSPQWWLAVGSGRTVWVWLSGVELGLVMVGIASMSMIVGIGSSPWSMGFAGGLGS